MDKEKYEGIKKKYGRYASWAIWDETNIQDTSIIEKNFQELHSDVVMVALNISTPLGDWGSFYNFHYGKNGSIRKNAKKICDAFNNSSYRGAYMTDILKDVVGADSSKIMTEVRSGNVSVETHIKRFNEEMDCIDATKNTLFILFGGNVSSIFRKYCGRDYKNFIEIFHYSIWGTAEKWVSDTEGKIRSYCKDHPNVRQFRESV